MNYITHTCIKTYSHYISVIEKCNSTYIVIKKSKIIVLYKNR